MARTRGTKRLSERTSWFPYRSNHPYTGQLNLPQQSLDPELEFHRIIRGFQLEHGSGSGYDAEGEEETEGLNSDHELVGPLSSEIRVSGKFEENGGDQETEAEGDGEEDEKLGVLNGNLEPENQDPSGLYHLQENDNGYDNSSDDHDRNARCQTQPGTSPDFSEPEREMGMMKDQENDYETGMDRLRVWLNQVGLGKYEPLFDLHDVNGEFLRYLTIEDLKDMGVTAVGSRWKIYWYIQKFCI